MAERAHGPLLRASEAGRRAAAVVPDGVAWNHVAFDVVRLGAGERVARETVDDEVVLVFIEGNADVVSSDGSWERVGGRSTPFDGPPQSIYLSAHVHYEIRAIDACEVAVCAASARGVARPSRVMRLSESDAHQRGGGSAERTIYDILMDPQAASSLFVTEVLTPPGHWSSYPPHKHDTDDLPRESQLEELYYYRMRPASGFAFQRIYTADRTIDETITAHDRDVVLVPCGYHVCAAAAEYAVYYLNVLAGPRHAYAMSFDPAHEWIKEGWSW